MFTEINVSKVKWVLQAESQHPAYVDNVWLLLYDIALTAIICFTNYWCEFINSVE